MKGIGVPVTKWNLFTSDTDSIVSVHKSGAFSVQNKIGSKLKKPLVVWSLKLLLNPLTFNPERTTHPKLL